MLHNSLLYALCNNIITVRRRRRRPSAKSLASTSSSSREYNIMTLYIFIIMLYAVYGITGIYYIIRLQ